MQDLTDRQREVLNCIREYFDRHQYAPTVREIGRRLGINSPNGVRGHLLALRRKGLLDWQPKEARTLVLT